VPNATVDDLPLRGLFIPGDRIDEIVRHHLLQSPPTEAFKHEQRVIEESDLPRAGGPVAIDDKSARNKLRNIKPLHGFDPLP
jgi:hypothetical protein